MIRIALPTAFLTAALLAFSACGGGGTTTTSSTVAAPAIRHVSNTGVGPLDQALDAALTPDRIEMARLTGYHHVACAEQGGAEHPACRDNEPAGTEVEVLPKLGCTDPGFVRPEDVPVAYGDDVGAEPKLDGVYKPADGTAHWDEDYVAVLATGVHDNGASAGIALHVENGRIVAIEDDCGDLLHLLDASRVGSWIVQPGASGPATPEATPAQ